MHFACGKFDWNYFADLDNFGLEKQGLDASAPHLFQFVCVNGIFNALFLELLESTWIPLLAAKNEASC